MQIRQFDEATGELRFAGVKDVTLTGERPCILLRTKLGYELICTPDHAVLTPNGYIDAGKLTVGAKVYVNGTDDLYKNYQWLYNQSITLNKTFVEISNEFGFNVNTIKKWARKLGIPRKGTGYFHIGHVPWNKGISDDRQSSALRRYHHCGRRKEGLMKQDTVNYWKHRKPYCEICGSSENLEVHHIDFNHGNNDVSNLITACESCHRRIHSQNLQTAYADEIVEICDAGVRTVYDIEMDSDSHNFVANGVIVHNCNYSSGKFGNEITVVSPTSLEPGSSAYTLWEVACKNAETAYFLMLESGCTPQIARSVLPNSLKAEIMMTANLREWRHFFALRCSAAAHPSMREVALIGLRKMHEAIPVVFDDLAIQYLTEGGESL